MRISFASCQPNYVLDFLRNGYPDSEVNWDKLPKLKSGIERDIVRITDPKYHTLALVAGKNYKPENKDEMLEIAREINKL